MVTRPPIFAKAPLRETWPLRDTKHTAFPRLRSISILLYTNYQRRTKSSFKNNFVILICDESAEVFPLQLRSSKVAKLNSFPVLFSPVHNILLPAWETAKLVHVHVMSSRPIRVREKRTLIISIQQYYLKCPG